MSIIRLKPPPHYTKSYYHCFSRVAGGDFLFEAAEKDRFTELVREYESFCGVTVITYQAMSNHFHLELEVPRAPEVMPNDVELVKLLDVLSTKQARKDRDALQRYIQEGQIDLAGVLRARLFARMWNLSQFMKLLLERFSQWFNRKHNRKGTLWQGPFGCEMVAGAGTALAHQSAYIDLNAVRAGIVEDPATYHWGGFAQAMAGDPKAIRGLRIVVGAQIGVDPNDLTEDEVLKNYRQILAVPVAIKGPDQEGHPVILGFSRERCLELFNAGKNLPADQFLRCNVRYMTAGLVIGSKSFVEEVFQANRDQFGSTRMTGARKVRGLAGVELYTLRDLRKKVMS